MPPRKYGSSKTTYKSKRKTVYRKKKVYKKRTSKRMGGPFTAYNTMDPFKPYFNCKLSFTHTLTLSSGAGNVFGAENVYRLNSLYDPDYTGGTGIQPYGFDTLSQMYRKYKVGGVLLNIEISDPSADGTVFAANLQAPSEIFTLPGTTSDRVREQPMSVIRNINNSGKQTMRIKQYIPLNILLGVSKLQFKSDLDIYAAATTANPVATPYLRIAMANERSVASTVLVRVTLTYYSHFYERAVLPRSL